MRGAVNQIDLGRFRPAPERLLSFSPSGRLSALKQAASVIEDAINAGNWMPVNRPSAAMERHCVYIANWRAELTAGFTRDPSDAPEEKADPKLAALNPYREVYREYLAAMECLRRVIWHEIDPETGLEPPKENAWSWW